MQCVTPFDVKNPRHSGVGSSERFIPVPCGKCPACLSRRTSQWSFRLVKQSEVSNTSLFVTLTYDNEHVPIMLKPGGSGYMTLVKKHVQDFLKRLRKISPKSNGKISYYCAGEYGSQFMRPHYHLIMFNAEAKYIDKAWTAGSVYYGDVTGASAGYTCKYINKGKAVPVHRNDDRVPEFSLMSKRMGVSYLTPQILKYHRDDVSRMYITMDGGARLALPRYYKQIIFSDPNDPNRYVDSLRLSAHLVATKADQAERQRYDSYVAKHGNADNYIRDRYESRKAAISNFRKRAKEMRNKL